MNSEWATVLVAFFASLSPTIVAIAVLVKATKIQKSVNGRMDELVKLARAEAKANAIIEEREKVATQRKGDYRHDDKSIVS